MAKKMSRVPKTSIPVEMSQFSFTHAGYAGTGISKFEQEVLQLFENPDWKVSEARKNDFPVFNVETNLSFMGTRTDLARERRYYVRCVPELTVSDIQQTYTALRKFLSDPKRKVPAEEVWLVGQVYSTSRVKASVPKDARYFRVLDMKELKEALASPSRREKRARTARTRIGKAVEANGEQILVAVAALMLQIEAKIKSLRDFTPNHPDTIANWNAEISDFERMKGELQTIREMVVQFRKNEVSEAKAVATVKTFSDGVRLWWNKSHDKICDKAYDMGMFATAVTVCSIAGASGNVGVALSAAMVGGKPVVDVVKALSKKFLPS